MELQDIRTRCKTRFRDPAGIIVTDDTWDEHINAAYREFLRAARWPFLITDTDFVVAANSHTVTLTDTVLAGIKDLKDHTNGRILQPLPNDLPWKLRVFLESQKSLPVFYKFIGKDVYLVPAPKDGITLKVFYFTDPTELEQETDEPELPERYQEALISGAMAKAHVDDQNGEQAALYRQEFDQILDQAIQELGVGNPRDPFFRGGAPIVDEVNRGGAASGVTGPA